MFTRHGLYTLMHQISRRNGAAMAQKIQTLFIDDLDGYKLRKKLMQLMPMSVRHC